MATIFITTHRAEPEPLVSVISQENSIIDALKIGQRVRSNGRLDCCKDEKGTNRIHDDISKDWMNYDCCKERAKLHDISIHFDLIEFYDDHISNIIPNIMEIFISPIYKAAVICFI
jgi:hypothetical protein